MNGLANKDSEIALKVLKTVLKYHLEFPIVCFKYFIGRNGFSRST